MVKILKWSSHNYEGKYNAYEAKITQLDFIKSANSFRLRYLVVEHDIGEISLYLECCNDPLFIIGSYTDLDDAFAEANKHYNELLMSMSLVAAAS